MRLLDGQFVLSPSDLTKFTRCAHVTTLDLGRIRGTLKPLAAPQRSLHTDFIAGKGTEHEEDYIERLDNYSAYSIFQAAWPLERTAKTLKSTCTRPSSSTSRA